VQTGRRSRKCVELVAEKQKNSNRLLERRVVTIAVVLNSLEGNAVDMQYKGPHVDEPNVVSKRWGSQTDSTFWMQRNMHERVEERGTSHDGVPAFLVHDVDPKSVITLIRLAPCLFDQLNHLAKGLVGQPKSKLLQAPDDKLT
jgi:hypothetical protein